MRLKNEIVAYIVYQDIMKYKLSTIIQGIVSVFQVNLQDGNVWFTTDHIKP